MPRSDFTDITLILDRSGSMQEIKEATITAFNEFVTSQRGGAGQAHISLVQFDDQYEPLYEGVPVEKASELTAATFVPRGSTALIDAMCRTIERTGERLAALPEADRPGTVLIVTLTDGLENSSRHFTIQKLNEWIARQRDVYSWQFLYLGANQDAIATAGAMGIHADQAMTFYASPEGTRAAMKNLSPKLHRLREANVDGLAAPPLAFDESDRAEAMAEEEKPKKPRKRWGK